MPKNPDDFDTLKFDSNKMKEALAEMERKKAAGQAPKPAHRAVSAVPRPAPKPAAPAPAARVPVAAPAKAPAPPPGPILPTQRPAAEVAKLFRLSDEGKKLLQDGMTVKAFLEVLVKNKHFQDAVRLLGFAMPKREAVWWAARCARAAAGESLPPEAKAALDAAEKWVKEPKEENRQPAMTMAEAAGLGTPAGCAALAAFWSGGSLAPPNSPVVPPGETLTSHGAASAVLLAGVAAEPDKAPAKYTGFLEEGVKLAEGAADWPGKAS